MTFSSWSSWKSAKPCVIWDLHLRTEGWNHFSLVNLKVFSHFFFNIPIKVVYECVYTVDERMTRTPAGWENSWWKWFSPATRVPGNADKEWRQVFGPVELHPQPPLYTSEEKHALLSWSFYVWKFQNEIQDMTFWAGSARTFSTNLIIEKVTL